MSDKKDKNISKTNSNKDIYHIDKFKLNPDQITQIFPRAFALPTFFTQNLLSSNRIVKVFTGSDAILKVFYFQLMKLGLELQVQQIDYAQLIKNKLIRYELFDEGQLQDEYFSDFQYRKFLKDFMQIVQEDDIPNFQQKISIYPIIDEILLKIFKLLVPLPLQMQIPNNTQSQLDIVKQLLQTLSQHFKITFTQFDRCFKFQQADIFLYVQHQDELYVAFNQFAQSVETQSNFKSTFVCGQSNSFVTKYHSHADSNKKTYKANQQTILAQLNAKTVQDFQNSNNKKSISSKDKQKTASKQGKKQLFNKVQLLGNNKKMQKKDDSYYRQFTDSTILKVMQDKYTRDIRIIKDKYKRRQNIRPFI